MPSLKPSSITSFFAAKPSTIAKKRKLQVIEIDADDEDPTEAVIVVDNAGTEQDNRLVDVTFVVDGYVLLAYFRVLQTLVKRLRSPIAIPCRLGAMLTSIWYTTMMPTACTVGPAAKQTWTLYGD